jgi:secondary thiamine-phosphate synthase enzyme
VLEVVRRSGIGDGLVNIQTRHTTTAVMVNEHEPLLLEDMKQTLERLACRTSAYRHDDFTVRTVNMCPDEEKNGHSHCKAMFLRASETLNLSEGRVQLGQWQRIFLIELDRGKRRTLSVTVMGTETPLLS